MKPIIVIDLPLGMGIDREITEPYGYDLFYGDENIEAQWKKLEELRETGGVIIVQPSHTSAVREILNPYIGEDGFIKECGLRKVHTEEHGDFCIILYHNPSEVMALRAFYLNSKKEIAYEMLQREFVYRARVIFYPKPQRPGKEKIHK